MEHEIFKINQVPAAIWGKTSEEGIIAVHGNLSNKTDVPIAILAENALPRGYQVLSFDLPEHGSRKQEGIPCKVQNCVKDLIVVMEYAKTKWKHISLFANSMGAYFSLLAYADEVLEKAWFLSPVVDMRRILETIMRWFQVSEARLQEEQTIPTPIGLTLYWDYYCYVKEHPVHGWKVPTHILYGGKDDLCERDTICQFAERFSCNLEIVPEAEHYFHTPEQLQALDAWMKRAL